MLAVRSEMMACDQGVHGRLEVLAEPSNRKCLCVPPYEAFIEFAPHCLETLDARLDRIDRLFAEMQTRDPVDHGLAGSPSAVCKHGRPTRLRLYRADTEILFGGKHVRLGGLQIAKKYLVRLIAENLNVVRARCCFPNTSELRVRSPMITSLCSGIEANASAMRVTRLYGTRRDAT